MVGKERKAEQQPEQVGEDDPFVRHVKRESAQPGAGLEAGEGELVEHDRGEAGQRDGEDMAMEKRDAQQRQREQHKLERDTSEAHAFSAACTSSSIFFASPNSMRLLSL